jgi:hypothetical protein
MILTVTCVLMGTAGLGVVTLAQPQTQKPLPPGCPDVRLWQESNPSTQFAGGIVRTVSTDTVDRTIALEWKLCSPLLPNAAQPKNTQSSCPEVFATPYWPTCTMVVDDYHLCVAGKARNGDVVLEHWTFGTMSPQGGAVPHASSIMVVHDPKPQYMWSLPPRSSVTEVLRASSANTGLVRALFRDPGSTDNVFVWYDADKTVHRVNVATGTDVLCASPTTQSSGITIPQLTGNYDTFTSGDYVGKGYCLFCSQGTVSPDGSVAPSIVLRDSNRDGTIDTSAVLTSASWIADGWADAIVISSY